MKAKFLCSIVSAALFSVAAYAQFPGGGFPGGGFPGGFGGRFPFDPQEQGGQMPGGFPGGPGGGGFGGGFMMGTEYDPTTTRNDVEFTSSNLPIVIIQTDNRTLTNREKTGATMKIIDNGSKRNKVTDKANGYDGRIKIKLRGNSSLFFDQKRFTFETLKEDDKKNKVELLGMPADNDWVLLAPYNDISMMRDVFAFDMWNNMGHWAPRTRYCEVVMNGRYIGVYILCEKIKRAENRLDIAKLKKSDTTGLDITGGYIVRIDPPDEGEKSFQSEVPGIITTGGMGGFGGGFPGGPGGGFGGRATVTWTYFYPKSDKLTPEQEKYISDYIKTTEKVIQSDNFADPKEGYAKYIDVESFVDYIIHTELSLNADGLKRSTYFYKTKQNADGTGGKLHAGTVWDYNLAYGNCNFANANKIDAWVYEGGETNPTPAMFKRLMEDPAFVAKVKARWKELRKGYLSDANINRFIDEHAAQLQEAQARQYTKYSDLLVPKSNGQQNGQDRQNGGFGGFGGGFGGFGGGFPGGMGGFGGGGAAGMFSAYSVSSYDEEISILKKWFADRIAFLDKNWK